MLKQDKKKLKSFNAAMCSTCRDIVISLYTHDFSVCSCWKESNKNEQTFIDTGLAFKKDGTYTKAMERLVAKRTGIAVDGGYDYHRRLFNRNSYPINLEFKIPKIC